MAYLSGKDKIKEFDYEKKVWGAEEVRLSPFYIQGLKLRYTLDALKGIKGKVLDIGCGGGNMAKAIKFYRPDLDVYGIDISKTAIKVAKKNVEDVNFISASCEKIPFKDHTFDALVMYDVLEHMAYPDKTIIEMKRILKKGGLIHVFSPLDGQENTLYSLIYKIGWQPKNEHTGHLQVFSDESFTKLFKKHKLKFISKRYSFHFIFSMFDIAYFSIVKVLNLNPGSSIEGIIGKRKSNIFFNFFNLIYRIVIAIGYYESLLLSRIPGGGGHYTFNKS